MPTFFLACALIGAVVLIGQLALGAAGLEHAGDAGARARGGARGDGLDLLGARALSAGVSFFGIAGAAGLAAGLPGWLAVGPALAVGGAATLGIALAVRAMMRLEAGRTLLVPDAIGAAATVRLGIPGERTGAGSVCLTVQDRDLELPAVTPADALPAGAAVTIVGIAGPDTVVVVPAPPR